MAFILTTGSLVICGHGGTEVLTSSAKLTVGGNPVLLESDAPGWSFSPSCGQNTPCTNIVTVTGGASSKLSVGGVAVLTDQLAGTTNGSPSTTDLSATAIQSQMEVSS